TPLACVTVPAGGGSEDTAVGNPSTAVVPSGTSRNDHDTIRLPPSGPTNRTRTDPTVHTPSSSTVKPAARHVSGGSATTSSARVGAPMPPTVQLPLHPQAMSNFPPTHAVPLELPPGATLQGGRYVVRRMLGRGGFGITYGAEDTRLHRPVALKELFCDGAFRYGGIVTPPAHAADAFEAARARFLREASVLARFTHPGIVRVYEVFEEAGTAYLVMELLEGQTLYEHVVARGAPLQQKQALDVAQQCAEALAVVHGAGILHRDLNPSNVMLASDGRVVLIDFGLAREYTADETTPMTRMVTPGYAPPEQYAADVRSGRPADVYAHAAHAAAPARRHGVEARVRRRARRSRAEPGPPPADGRRVHGARRSPHGRRVRAAAGRPAGPRRDPRRGHASAATAARAAPGAARGRARPAQGSRPDRGAGRGLRRARPRRRVRGRAPRGGARAGHRGGRHRVRPCAAGRRSPRVAASRRAARLPAGALRAQRRPCRPRRRARHPVDRRRRRAVARARQHRVDDHRAGLDAAHRGGRRDAGVRRARVARSGAVPCRRRGRPRRRARRRPSGFPDAVRGRARGRRRRVRRRRHRVPPRTLALLTSSPSTSVQRVPLQADAMHTRQVRASCQWTNARTSAASSAWRVAGLHCPWPAFDSMRTRIGCSVPHDVAACTRAANLRACSGSTRLSS